MPENFKMSLKIHFSALSRHSMRFDIFRLHPYTLLPLVCKPRWIFRASDTFLPIEPFCAQPPAALSLGFCAQPLIAVCRDFWAQRLALCSRGIRGHSRTLFARFAGPAKKRGSEIEQASTFDQLLNDLQQPLRYEPDSRTVAVSPCHWLYRQE